MADLVLLNLPTASGSMKCYCKARIADVCTIEFYSRAEWDNCGACEEVLRVRKEAEQAAYKEANSLTPDAEPAFGYREVLTDKEIFDFGLAGLQPWI